MSISPEGMFTFAVNSGELYPYYVKWAKERRSVDDWSYHVKTCLIHKYRTEFNEPFEGMSLEDISITGKLLKDYYEKHIQEVLNI
jgi:hypothetical protein